MNSPTRMMARLVLLVGIALCTLGYSKCVFVSDTGGTGGIDNGGGNGPGTGTFQTTLVLRDSAGVATTNFTFGQAIRFDLEVRNRTATTVNLVFPDTQIYDFVVLVSTSARVRWGVARRSYRNTCTAGCRARSAVRRECACSLLRR